MGASVSEGVATMNSPAYDFTHLQPIQWCLGTCRNSGSQTAEAAMGCPSEEGDAQPLPPGKSGGLPRGLLRSELAILLMQI